MCFVRDRFNLSYLSRVRRKKKEWNDGYHLVVKLHYIARNTKFDFHNSETGELKKGTEMGYGNKNERKYSVF